MRKDSGGNQLAKLLRTQKSLTEWLEDISHDMTQQIRAEDNDKRERLRVLNEILGIPFDKPTQFKASELVETNKKFSNFLNEHGKDLCALRLIPLSPDLPKLRMRGKSVEGAFEWFKEQDIDVSKYRADFMPHTINNSWGTIFIVNKQGIQGEIISGGHHQLTQGFHDNEKPVLFKYDYKDWHLSKKDDEIQGYLEELITYIHVPDTAKRRILEKKLDATFTHKYINGYFETTDSEAGLWYVDYAPTLGKMYSDIDIQTDAAKDTIASLQGRTGSSGLAEGVVKIVMPKDLQNSIPENCILVCPMTTPEYVPLMMKASAIITDQGGILSHAAIVARELKKPCIVSAVRATTTLKDGQRVKVDADAGTVTVIN